MHLPYGFADLRRQRGLDEYSVCCHVRDCETVVPRQRRRFQACDKYLCPAHGIYLSPSTFEYRDRWRNLIWREEPDRSLMHTLGKVKRTSARLGRERDEDALTWNVFRAHHREGRLRQLARAISGERRADVHPDAEPQIVYWSADPATGELWEPLRRAREQFGEPTHHGTEPDVVLWWPGEHVIFVEAKFCAHNTTWPRPKAGGHDHRPTAYSDNSHFPSVLRGTYEEIAVEARKYELMRMWLLGTWIAKEDRASFSLVNLVCWINERDIGERFGTRFCRQDSRRTFVRANWEDIWEALPDSGLSGDTIEILDSYFRDKTAGYHSGGVLCRAFVDETNGTGRA